MSSINTNASAMTALQTLAATNKALNTTQGRIATGLRVAEASDNAAYWSIATTMRSDNKALSTVQDSLGLGASKVDTAYTGMNKAIDTLNEIKVKIVAASGASDADKAKIDTEIKALQKQLKAYADGATFSGANMLSVSSGAAVAADVKVVSAFTRDASGTASISTIDINVEGIKLYEAGAGVATTGKGILDSNRTAAGVEGAAAAPTLGAAAVAADTYTVATMQLTNGTLFASDTQIGAMLGVVESALKDMNTAATNLGAAKNRIELQKAFTSSLMDSIDRGVGQLVDADMNKESPRLQAIQVQQQLGIQALSIANGNSQSILSLFRG
ncbi:flagellin N-terminal helical domain-containing protein [Aminobacter niigataensis]|uniref:flagellin N-terminal helical domain-containing protein n=1 Tax=Aminobacter niigataensis TaxID=83265 RepID=UPI0024CB62E9|nr:flagellin [Aminobacter niigataensis]CAI2933365.1 Flagellin [Aminobacter niigataensis]